MICYFKGPYFVGVIITRTAFWLPVIIVHIHNFLTVIFYCYINVCTILKRFSIKKKYIQNLPIKRTEIVDLPNTKQIMNNLRSFRIAIGI